MIDEGQCEICGAPATAAYRDSRAGKLQPGRPDKAGKITLWQSSVPGDLHLRCSQHPGEAVRLPPSPEDSDYNIALCREHGVELVPILGETCEAAR